MHMTLLEATRKKVDFCQHVIDHLQLADTRAVWGRAEDVGRDPDYREHYDLVFARAVADLSVLAEYTLPFCQIGGQVIAQKGISAQQETHAAEHAIGLLGGQVQRVIPVELHGLAEMRNLVVIDKTTRTPERYPRRAGMPAKRPLKK
jgi:16S rRNA (guanine527-N7)-methyltransferase